MHLTLSEDVISDLAVLGKLPQEYVQEFCKLCLDFLENGMRTALFKRASGTVGVEPEVLQASVVALTEVFLESTKFALTENEVHASLTEVEMSDAHRRQIAQFCIASQPQLSVKLASAHAAGASPLPQYNSLKWRLEVVVSKRHVQDAMAPQFTMQLDTVGAAAGSKAAAEAKGAEAAGAASSAKAAAGGSSASGAAGLTSFAFTSDYAALSSVLGELEQAAAELKSNHSKRVMRYIR